MNAQLYTLRWRGKESGPHSFQALERMLEESQICIWHDVLRDGQWTTVEELLKAMAPKTPPLAARGVRRKPPRQPPPRRAAPSAAPRRVKLPILHRRG